MTANRLTQISIALQLGASAAVVVPVGILYGADPTTILPWLFGFAVEDIELKNIFRANMGLYLALSGYWILAVVKPVHRYNATLVNCLFMGGLAAGRIVSTIVDGYSPQFTTGLLLELFFLSWGGYNLRRADQAQK